MTRVSSFFTVAIALVFAATAFAQREEGQRGGIPIPPVEAEPEIPDLPDRPKPGSEKAQKQAKYDFGPMTPENVLNKLHVGNQKEIAMGHLALEKASSEEVKDFARRLIEDHAKADKQVVHVAGEQNIALKDLEADEKHQKKHKDAMAKLEALSGEEFDEAFLKHMDKDHEKHLALLRKAQAEIDNESISQLIAQLQPTIRQHERIVDNLLGMEMAEDADHPEEPDAYRVSTGEAT